MRMNPNGCEDHIYVVGKDKPLAWSCLSLEEILSLLNSMGLVLEFE